MSILLLALVAALQTQSAQVQSAPPLIPVVALTPARPASVPAPAPTPAPAEAAAEVEPEPEEEPVVEQPRTREVCRFVERPGWRFPERRCRTVVIQDDR